MAKLKQFAGEHFGGFGGGEGSSICGEATYSSREDIELIFGQKNVAKWADLNNTGADDDIDERCCWALHAAYNFLNDRLRGGVLVVPFESPFPRRIVEMSARYAGVLLYESRGVTDNDDGKHELMLHRKQVEQYTKDLSMQRERLADVETRTSYPKIIE